MAKKGVKFSEEHKKKLSEARRTSFVHTRHNKPHSNQTKSLIKEKRKLQKITEETKKKISLSLKGKTLGRTRTDEAKRKMGLAHKGEKCYFWKGGISFFPYTKEWTQSLRRIVRKRDNHICQLCCLEQTDYLFHVHHIDYNKLNCNPENLITLCRPCHARTNVNRQYWQDALSALMRIRGLK